jgi:hypothetical protein
MHATWSPGIAPAVCEIYAYWLPHRAGGLSYQLPRTHWAAGIAGGKINMESFTLLSSQRDAQIHRNRCLG